jgi:hypothetical protein
MDRIEQAENDLMEFDVALKAYRVQEAQARAMAAQAQALLALCDRLDAITDEGNGCIRTSTWRLDV